MNIVLENSEKVACCTDMAAIFLAMDVDPRAYDWYVSDMETNATVPLLDEGDVWVTGDELGDLLGEQIQFIWGVFSAFLPGVRAAVNVAPAADGNRNFWRPPDVSPQVPGACFEVVCWDSTATLLVGVSPSQAAGLLRAYPYAKPLSSSWPKEGA